MPGMMGCMVCSARSINDSPFIEHNKKRSPLAGLDIPCAMTAARYIFHQQDFASSQGAATAVRHLELYCSLAWSRFYRSPTAALPASTRYNRAFGEYAFDAGKASENTAPQ